MFRKDGKRPSMAVTETQQKLVLLDTGVFIGALFKGDARHAEAGLWR
jgi:hypothetical protein